MLFRSIENADDEERLDALQQDIQQFTSAVGAGGAASLSRVSSPATPSGGGRPCRAAPPTPLGGRPLSADDGVLVTTQHGLSVSGTADAASGSITDAIIVDPGETEPGEFPWFVQTLLPQDDSLRGMGRLVAHSPRFAQDGVLFGAHGFEIMISTDKGATWSALTRLDHTTADNGDFQIGRASCRERV